MYDDARLGLAAVSSLMWGSFREGCPWLGQKGASVADGTPLPGKAAVPTGKPAQGGTPLPGKTAVPQGTPGPGETPAPGKATVPGPEPGPGEDWDLWAPFLALRPSDRRAERLRAHIQEDVKRGARHLPRRAAALSREEIVRTAIAVADAEGADAISMRRIARELNAGTMSLYWHVTSKEELLDLMIDSIQGEMLAPDPSGDWRKDLRVMAWTTRSVLHSHRWMMDFLGGRPPMGPKSLRSVERALGCLDGLGLSPASAMNIVMTLGTYVLGAALREVQEANAKLYHQQQSADLSEAEKAELMRTFRARLRATGHYPHLVAMIESGVDPDAPETRDARFEFGLDCLLNGFAAHLSNAAPASEG
jgi:AcrR family transcriptional regulator